MEAVPSESLFENKHWICRINLVFMHRNIIIIVVIIIIIIIVMAIIIIIIFTITFLFL